MFYHALTGGDTPTEDLEPVLLWENSDVTAEFAAQTISLDLTDYAGVIIEYNQDNTTNKKLSGRLYIKKGESNIGSGQTYTPNQANARNITQINNNGVTFGDAISSNDASNNIFIPTKIYGVKKYIVEPVGTFKIDNFKGMENVETGYGGTLILDTNSYSTLKIGTLYGNGNDGMIYITGINSNGESSRIIECTTTMTNLEYDISNYVKVEFHSRYTGSMAGNTSYAKNIELL